MSANAYCTRNYENNPAPRLRQNKPNQTQYKPKTDPISSPLQAPLLCLSKMPKRKGRWKTKFAGFVRLVLKSEILFGSGSSGLGKVSLGNSDRSFCFIVAKDDESFFCFKSDLPGDIQDADEVAFNLIIPCGLPQGENKYISLLKLDTLRLAVVRFI